MIIDTTPDRPRVIGEIGPVLGPGARPRAGDLPARSAQYHVDKLDWGERKAYVRRVDVDYYTYANRAVTLKPLDVFAEAPAPGGRRVHGEVMVASLVTLFKKLKFGTDENVGWGPIDLPGAGAPDDRLLADRGGRGRSAGGGTTWTSRCSGAGPGDPGRRRRPADGRPARPRPRDPGPLAALTRRRRSTCTRRCRAGSACPSGCGSATRSSLAGAAELIAAAPARPAVRPAPARGSSPTSMRGRSRCGCSAELDRRRRRSGGGPRGAGGRRMSGATLERRLANYRATLAASRTRAGRPAATAASAADRSARRAAGGRGRRRAALDPAGPVVRCEPADGPPAARSGAARALPGHAAAGRPPRLPGHGDDRARDGGGHPRLPRRARLVGGRPVPPGRSSCCRTMPAEPALLARSPRHLPPDAWLVTYNGRGFDWPLLVARYRMARPPRRPSPATSTCCRSSAACSGTGWPMPACGRSRPSCSGRTVIDDVEGWQIPGRYLDFLRGGPAEPLMRGRPP